ncbi:MAG: amidase family protein, partial [Acidimicrobiales bacterium]
PFSLVRAHLDPAVRDATWRIAGILEGLGHGVAPRDVRWGVSAGLSFLPRSFGGLHEWRRRAPDPSALDDRTRANCRRGAMVGPPVLGLAYAMEKAFARRMRAALADLDVVVCPTTASPPLRIGACDGLDGRRTDQAGARACPFAWPWNVVGWPAVNVPASFTAEGLPIGVQLLGPQGSEARLLSLAAQLEAAERWDLRWPPGSGPDPRD